MCTAAICIAKARAFFHRLRILLLPGILLLNIVGKLISIISVRVATAPGQSKDEMNASQKKKIKNLVRQKKTYQLSYSRSYESKPLFKLIWTRVIERDYRLGITHSR